MKETVLIGILFWFCIPTLLAQDIPIGTWRSHLNYSDSRLLALYNGNIYVAAVNGLFYVSRSDNSINKLTKNDGLGDVGVTAMAITPDNEKLIIGYSSGHVDILEGSNLTHVDAIKKMSGPDDKAIRDIAFQSGLAYLSTGFGVAILDYQQGIVIEASQSLGENGQLLSAGSATIFKDSLFLSTPDGIIGTSLSLSNNLMDFNNWFRFKNQAGYPNSQVGLITTYNNRMYVSFLDSGLYSYEGNHWEKIDFFQELEIRNLIANSSELYVLADEQDNGKIFKLNTEDEVVEINTDKISKPSDLVILEDGAIWVADREWGLVTDIMGIGERIFPRGPLSDKINRLAYYENSIAGIEKGIDNDFLKRNVRAELAIFQEGKWENYTSENTSFLAGINDVTDLSYDSQTSNLLISTFGSGILGFHSKTGEFSRPFDQKNSPFTSANISALTTSNDGFVWVNEYNNPDKLWGVFDSQWNEFQIADSHVKEIKTIPYQYVWLRLVKGLLVLDPETGNSRELTLGNKSLINDTVTAYAIDKNGYIWYGTPAGVAYLVDQGEIFEEGINSNIPEYQNGSLFEFQRIDALEIDAANRKWIATSEGLWLFSEDGDSLIYHFTEENSPLVSNAILDIEINASSGEVFIATNKGLVSYRSNTSAGEISHQQVKIFPNPVKPDYSGIIGISGVVDGAIVKITDLSGNLVREIHARGGTATWDGNSLAGRKVNSGIYLVFSASEDGKETFIGKIAFLN